MASIPFWFGSNALYGAANTVAASLANVTSTKKCLVVFWDDLASALSGSPSEPTTGEDWLAGINFNAVSVTSNTINSNRKAVVTLGGLSIDQGFYIAGQTFEVYPVSVQFYLPSTLPERPGLIGG